MGLSLNGSKKFNNLIYQVPADFPVSFVKQLAFYFTLSVCCVTDNDVLSVLLPTGDGGGEVVEPNKCHH